MTPDPVPAGHIRYESQSGDTLEILALRFEVDEKDILFAEQETDALLLDPGTLLYIPAFAGETSRSERIIPDSDVVYSPSAIDFDIHTFVDGYSGKLAGYTQLMNQGTTVGAEIIHQLAVEHSINPRIFLTLLEFQSGWITGEPETYEEGHYPYNFIEYNYGGLYRQMGLLIETLNIGYYGWRAGTFTELTFLDGGTLRLDPSLNAGTVAVMNYLAAVSTREEWEQALYGENNVAVVHTQLFGDAWERAATVEPLFPAGSAQPELNLPFPIGLSWNYACGPHPAWGKQGPEAALDFAPPLDRDGCGTSIHWATAAAEGLVVRSGTGVIVLDLDGDGYEQTGWTLLYMHLSSTDKVQVGDSVEVDQRVGHPSCAGGSSSGIHVHIARKYNGEWVLAEGGLPFVLSGYQAFKNEKFCEGTLLNEDSIIEAYPWGNYKTQIFRPEVFEEITYE